MFPRALVCSLLILWVLPTLQKMHFRVNGDFILTVEVNMSVPSCWSPGCDLLFAQWQMGQAPCMDKVGMEKLIN